MLLVSVAQRGPLTPHHRWFQFPTSSSGLSTSLTHSQPAVPSPGTEPLPPWTTPPELLSLPKQKGSATSPAGQLYRVCALLGGSKNPNLCLYFPSPPPSVFLHCSQSAFLDASAYRTHFLYSIIFSVEMPHMVSVFPAGLTNTGTSYPSLPRLS